MSEYNSERAEILLPPAAVPLVRRALARANEEHREAVFGAHRRLWDYPLRDTDPAERVLRLRAEMEHSPEDYDAMGLLHWLYTENLGRKPSVAQIEEAEGGRARRAGVRASLWLDTDLAVTLDGRTLEWEAEGDNRAVEKAYGTRTMRALMKVLREQVVWTAGTGGRAYGDDEYSDGEYPTGEYGPRGGHDAGMTTAEFERRNRHLFHGLSY